MIGHTKNTEHPLDNTKHQEVIQDELWKLKVERCDVTAGFDNLNKKLEVKVRQSSMFAFRAIKKSVTKSLNINNITLPARLIFCIYPYIFHFCCFPKSNICNYKELNVAIFW